MKTDEREAPMSPVLPPPTSLWTPMRQPVFRWLWIASFASYVGSLMQNVGAAWLMTSLAPHSPMQVALVQTANHLPTFLLALPAGALADALERRRLLLVTQLWMLLAAVLLGILTISGQMTPTWLLLLTFSLGLGSAMNAPAWQALTSDLVPREEVEQAVALNSAGFNLARAVGPGLGGLLVAAAGAGATFLCNAASFLGVLAVLAAWRQPPPTHARPKEPLRAAMLQGLRYVRDTPGVLSVLVRVGLFLLFASALWTLLPLMARFGLHTGPTGYGALLGCIGIGAVLGAIGMTPLRQRLGVDGLLSAASFLYGGGVFLAAALPRLEVVGPAMALAGAGWLMLLSTCNANVQACAPPWIRGRAMAVYLMVVFGSLTAGSALWGGVAARYGWRAALLVAAVGTATSGLATSRFRVPVVQREDVSTVD